MLETAPFPTVQPPTLFDLTAGDFSERRCWAIHTKARQEKALARDLLRLDVSYYLPLITRAAVYRRNRVSRSIPLFANYLFLFGSDEDRVHCLASNRVARVLAVSDQHQLHHDLVRLRHLIASGARVTLESRLGPGDKVRIKRGPLAGIEGTVLRRRQETRLLVSVHFLQQGASIAIDDYLVEPVT